MPVIEGLAAREILDSRGQPTIESWIWLDNGAVAVTSVPSGTSVGKYEALEIRDGDPQRMRGKGVLKAVTNLNTLIAPQLIGKDPSDQKNIDDLLINLDGTEHKSKLGANTLLAASQAVMKAGALASGLPLYEYIHQKYGLINELSIPTCIYTVVNGGDHGADNLDIQEFQIIPATYISFNQSLEMISTLFQKLEQVLIVKGAIHSVGMVGGFTPNLYTNLDVFEILIETMKTSSYAFAQDIFFGIDVAASALYQDGKYVLKDRKQPYTSSELLEYYRQLRSVYHVLLIEDGFQEDDSDSWQKLTADIGEATKIVGDDFLASNMTKMQKAIDAKACNSILLKPNQVGTISETIAIIQKAREANWEVIISHRSGETNDDFIADFAVGVGADYTKFGPPNRGERIAKYNRLLQIETELQNLKTS